MSSHLRQVDATIFRQRCPGADFNADNDINPDDLGDFITAFFVGC